MQFRLADLCKRSQSLCVGSILLSFFVEAIVPVASPVRGIPDEKHLNMSHIEQPIAVQAS